MELGFPIRTVRETINLNGVVRFLLIFTCYILGHIILTFKIEAK